jgi:hypothetical protein
MGDLKVGDMVLGTSGRPVPVTVKSGVHHRPCYRLTFNDTSSIVCDNVHLWTVRAGITNERTKYDAISTDDLFALWKQAPTSLRRIRPFIVNAAPLDLPDAGLPIDPYLLGAWLGDGKTRHGYLSVGFSDSDEMVGLLAQRWPGRTSVNREKTCNTVGLCHNSSHPTFTSLLRKEGLLGNKHIPVAYLRASYAQRLDLLRGLMDTDGPWNRGRRRAVFVTTLENMWR